MLEGRRRSKQHLPSLFAPFISIFPTSLPTHTPSRPPHTTHPTPFSPERHGEPHTHHHQSDASIFWTKTGEEIPPNLDRIEQGQTVATLTSSIPMSPIPALPRPFSLSVTPTQAPALPSFPSLPLPSLSPPSNPPLPAPPGSMPGPPSAGTRSLCLTGSQSTHPPDESS